ncbi:MAG: hypothetical protein WBA74_18170 [Cyclobacteriaceae bacterium]
MYSTVLILHSLFRWLVLISLVYTIIRAGRGYFSKSGFSYWDDKFRHWTATIAHIQLMLGVTVYIKSPLIKQYFADFKTSVSNWDLTFFGLFHIVAMLLAIVVITIGSAKAKRKATDAGKFKTMLIWFSIGLAILFIAIPWPFSPLANRPYIRLF